MRLKTVLLGSASAVLALSGIASAADAVEVAAEPESMEYVRVCDTYGTGYFYIPGTETCLRIGGYVRYDISAGNGFYGGHLVPDRENNPTGGPLLDHNETYHKEARLSLQTWTGTETELGKLETYTETRFKYFDGDIDAYHAPGNDVSLNFAWIQLGGFRIGKDESVFVTFSGYAGGVMTDDVITYGPFDTNLISYTFDAGNGFSAIVSLETGTGVDEIDSYVPHVVAGAKYGGGWGSVSLTGAYDSVVEEFAVKGRLDVNINDRLSVFAMATYGSTDDVSDIGEQFNYFKKWSGDWAVWAGGTYRFSDKAALNVQGSYTDAGEYSADGWAIAANVDYELVKDFHIIPEVNYSDLGFDDAPGTDGLTGFLRFQRNF